MASKKQRAFDIPKDAVIIQKDPVKPNQIVCPKCGRTGNVYYRDTKYLPGKRVNVYRCLYEGRYPQICNQVFYALIDAPDIEWVSDNGKWYVSRNEPRSQSGVAEYQISDGWNAGTVTLYSSGDIRMDEWVAYSVPKYVREQTVRMLESIRGSGPRSPTAGAGKAMSYNRRTTRRSKRRWPSTISRTIRPRPDGRYGRKPTPI